MLRSGLELLLGTSTTGVCERGEIVRAEAVSARPRVTEDSREGIEGPKEVSIVWCDVFRACASGEEAAAASRTAVSKSWLGVKKFQCPDRLAHSTAGPHTLPNSSARVGGKSVSLRFEELCYAEGHSKGKRALTHPTNISCGMWARIYNIDVLHRFIAC